MPLSWSQRIQVKAQIDDARFNNQNSGCQCSGENTLCDYALGIIRNSKTKEPIRVACELLPGVDLSVSRSCKLARMIPCGVTVGESKKVSTPPNAPRLLRLV
jgi:hypothetical protein